MLKEFLTTVAVIVSTSYGAQYEMMDIQDPEFSCESLANPKTFERGIRQ